MQTDRVCYVDSGSSDGSVAIAERLGVKAVLLSSDEPFTAARVMALNRMQQQQQRLQRGVLTALGSGSNYNQEGFRPPADSEYQSGDSIDSTMAEDSGGSDSSSSDLAD